MPSAPNLFQEVLPPHRLYFSLEGRIGRRMFWQHGVLGLGIASTVLRALFDIAGLDADRANFWANALVLWPTLAISVKRWHDRDRSGWWVLLYAVPWVGWVWGLVENGFRAGDSHANQYGPPPTS